MTVTTYKRLLRSVVVKGNPLAGEFVPMLLARRKWFFWIDERAVRHLAGLLADGMKYRMAQTRSDELAGPPPAEKFQVDVVGRPEETMRALTPDELAEQMQQMVTFGDHGGVSAA